MRLKKLIRQYGAVFFGTYFIAFIVIITFKGRFKFGTVPGDISIGENFYLPIASSLAIAAFVTVMLEFYKFTK